MTIRSSPGIGTTVRATFRLSHIDRQPLGNIADTITTLIAGRPDVDIAYRHEKDGLSVSFSTRDARRVLDDVPLSSPGALGFIRTYLTQEEDRLSHHT